MSSNIEKARQVKRAKDEERKKSLTETVEAILSDPMANNELKRKLAYCQREITRGRDAGLVKLRNTYVAEATRSRSY